MQNSKIIILVLSSISVFSFSGCGDSAQNKSNNVKLNNSTQLEDVKSGAEVFGVENLSLDQMKNEVSSYAQPASRALVANYAAKIVDSEGLHAARIFSNNLSSGKGVKRNVAAANIVAYEAYKSTPETWSALRSIHGFLFAVGLAKNLDKAREILNSNEDIVNSEGGQYYLGVYFLEVGDGVNAKLNFNLAASRGHSGAKRELDRMNAN